MASIPRARLSRLLGTRLNSRAALPRSSPISRWNFVAAASSSTWNGVQSAVGDLQFYQRQQLLQRQGYADGCWRISLTELKDGVLNVFKLFNKVKIEEFALDAYLVSDLPVDSLDAVGVVPSFKNDSGVEVSDEEAEHTCKDAYDFFQLLCDPS